MVGAGTLHCKMNALVESAVKAGATEAVVLEAQNIVVKIELADRCRVPQCENFGSAMSCPPHVAGPHGLLQELYKYQKAVFLRLDVPKELLYSSDSHELFRLLHEIVFAVETCAKNLGMHETKGFAGDSCKKAFCHQYSDCLPLRGELCRFPEARPSMSGYGIDVASLVKLAGWQQGIGPEYGNTDTGLTSIYGLVLLG
jgi:predicted metal-binding protein